MSRWSQLNVAAVVGEDEVGSFKPHIGGSVDSSTSGVVAMPIQVGGVDEEMQVVYASVSS